MEFAKASCRRILDGSVNSPAELCIMQRGFEIAVADVEHRQHAEQPDLVEDVTACFGNRQASAQGHTRRIALSMNLHRRNPQARLEIHLLGPTASWHRQGRVLLALTSNGIRGAATLPRKPARQPRRARRRLRDCRWPRSTIPMPREHCRHGQEGSISSPTHFQSVRAALYNIRHAVGNIPAVRRSPPVSRGHKPASSEVAGNSRHPR